MLLHNQLLPLIARATVLAVVASVLTVASSASAQQALPDLPRLAITDLSYEGAFRLPQYQDDVSGLGWSDGRIALGQDGESLFVTGHTDDAAIAEFPLTTPSMATTLQALPVAGSPLQGFATVLDRPSSGNSQAIDRIGGMLAVDGALIVNGYEYYDAPADNTHTTMALTNAADLASSPSTGWAAMNGGAHAAGWLSPIPAEWQSALGAAHLSGWSSGMPIIGRASVGPSAFAVDLEPTLSSLDAAQPLLDFPLAEPLNSDLSNDSGTNDLWTFLSSAVYGVVVPGTSTYLTIGSSGGHESGVSYGENPRGKGYFPNDLSDLSPYYWLWDVNDLADVRAGDSVASEIRPYDHGPLDLPFGDLDYSEWATVGGGAFDPTSGTLYVSLSHNDRVDNQYEPVPTILTYRLGEPNISEPNIGEASVSGPGTARAQLCPDFETSDLYRTPTSQITVGPDGNWEATLANAAPGTEILLADGVYEMTRYAVYLDNADVTIRSASGNRDSVIIQGQGYSVGSEGLMVAAPRITIADLTITATRNHAISLKPDVSEGAEETVIYNVNLVDNGTQQIKGSNGGDNRGGVLACSSIGYTPEGIQGDYIGAIDLHSSSDWTIRDNYIYGVSGDGTGCEIDIDCGTYVSSHPAILLWSNSSNITVERNIIVDSIRGITLGLGQGFDGGVVRNNFIYTPSNGDAGIELYDAANVVVEHNTVLSPGYPGAIEYGGSPNAVIRNNLVSAPPLDRPNRGDSPGVILEGNITDATVADLATPGEPGLAVNSRAIGAGVPTSLTIDIDGDARVGSWDVGADQLVDGSESSPVNELKTTVTCLAGNGRIDVNIVNYGDAAATYTQRVGNLSPRQRIVAPRTSWRSPVTGRFDGPLRVLVERDGVAVLDETVTVRCDDTPAPSAPEVQWFVWCVDGNGMVFAQMANPTAAARSYVLDVNGIRRSTTAAAHGAAFRGVSGRPDGTYRATVEVAGQPVSEATIDVAC